MKAPAKVAPGKSRERIEIININITSLSLASKPVNASAITHSVRIATIANVFPMPLEKCFLSAP